MDLLILSKCLSGSWVGEEINIVDWTPRSVSRKAPAGSERRTADHVNCPQMELAALGGTELPFTGAIQTQWGHYSENNCRWSQELGGLPGKHP